MKQILGFVDTDNNISRSLKHQRHKIKAALKKCWVTRTKKLCYTIYSSKKGRWHYW